MWLGEWATPLGEEEAWEDTALRADTWPLTLTAQLGSQSSVLSDDRRVSGPGRSPADTQRTNRTHAMVTSEACGADVTCTALGTGYRSHGSLRFSFSDIPSARLFFPSPFTPHKINKGGGNPHF